MIQHKYMKEQDIIMGQFGEFLGRKYLENNLFGRGADALSTAATKAQADGSAYKSNILDKPNVRLDLAGLYKGGMNGTTVIARAKFAEDDWRVRISVPGPAFYNEPGYSGIMQPLIETNGMIFPYTPMIMLSHSASYAAAQPTHSNYAQHFYGGSSVDMFTIAGEFTAQNQTEARYVLAVLTFLKSATKMFWGQDQNAGTPPPVLRLNGYGDHVFNNVPVVLTNFTFELGADVDYINANVSTSQSVTALSKDNSGRSPDALITRNQISISPTRVPTKTNVSMSLQPLYSRQQMREFGLKDFASGKLIGDQKSGKGGFA